MSTKEIASRYVNLCKEGKFTACVDELFSPDAVSVEAFSPPGAGERTKQGIAAIHGKGEWWTNNHEIHKGEVLGPYPSAGDQFAVRFVFDITHKPSGKRMNMDEVGLFTVKDGKIVREEFFYQGG